MDHLLGSELEFLGASLATPPAALAARERSTGGGLQDNRS